MNNKNNQVKYYSWFCVSVSVLLVLTATAKFIALMEGKPFLAIPDGVFTTIPTGDLLMLAAVLEVLVAAVVFFKRKDPFASVVCFWLVSVFVAYRLLAKALYAHRPCRCLGGVLDWTKLPTSVLDALPIIILVYIGTGSLLYLLLNALKNRQFVLKY